MKNILLLLVFALFAVTTSAQTAANPAAQTAADNLVAKYNLNADQAKTMYSIQARKQRNLNQIESIRESNPEKYRQKLASIQQGTLNSIKKLLRSPEQKRQFRATQASVADRKQVIRKEMSAKKADKAATETALLAVYEE